MAAGHVLITALMFSIASYFIADYFHTGLQLAYRHADARLPIVFAAAAIIEIRAARRARLCARRVASAMRDVCCAARVRH
jgi:hypothetical protein